MDQADHEKTYRTRLLEFLMYERKMLEDEKERLDGRLTEIHNHITAIVKDKNEIPIALERWSKSGHPKNRQGSKVKG